MYPAARVLLCFRPKSHQEVPAVFQADMYILYNHTYICICIYIYMAVSGNTGVRKARCMGGMIRRYVSRYVSEV